MRDLNVYLSQKQIPSLDEPEFGVSGFYFFLIFYFNLLCNTCAQCSKNLNDCLEMEESIKGSGMAI